jgi:transcriptional regulator with XRE-family HTH domain
MDNILADINFALDNFNPVVLAKAIRDHVKERRMEFNITQEELAVKSGVSLGSVKRFEAKAEISLKNLLMIALVLHATDDFLTLFTKKQYQSIADVVSSTKVKTQKRARAHHE